MYRILMETPHGTTEISELGTYQEALDLLKEHGFEQEEYSWIKGARSARIQRITDIEEDLLEEEVYAEYHASKKCKYNKAEKHQDICLELNEIYRNKNADYGDSFGDTYKKLGMISAVTRISDKVNRLQNLCKNERKVDESTIDSLKDLANYAIMTIIEMEEENES